MPSEVARARAAISEQHRTQLARSILGGGSNADEATMMLLEYCEPTSLEAAVALLVDQGAVTGAAFDRVADAWETYRHLKDVTWD